MVIYVGCPDDSQYDQVLEEFIVSPLPKGRQLFEMEIQPPDHTKIPRKDILGVTVIMVTAMFRRQEFFRCSFFVYNNYNDEHSNSKSIVDVDRVIRSILVKQPRVRINEILWDYPKHTEIVNENLDSFLRNFAKKTKKIKKEKRKRRKNGN